MIKAGRSSLEFITTGLPVSDKEDNLCMKAYYLLKKDFPSIDGVRIHLHKVIPMGSGLGGGSANGAFSIKILNRLFDLKLTNEQMLFYASQLGSDCPFFILGKPSFATGRGEVLTPADIDLSRYKIVVVNPRIVIKTEWAFSKVLPMTPAASVHEILAQPIAVWQKELINDFEAPVFEYYPEIKKIKKDLYEQGALYASLSGSGSTIFGIFEKERTIDDSKWNNYLVLSS